MTAPLTLPGTIPGLLRRCSPVTSEDGSARGLIYAMPGYYRAYPDWWGVNWNYLLQPCDATRLHLDLTDPTGRAHAAWWLVRSHHPQGGTALWRVADAGLRWWRLSWVSTGWGGNDGGLGSEVYAPLDVPALDHLNPDDTRLPDGSRWVDAEALRLACLHVAGVSS
mgnify:CR=1 FL=1